MLILNRRSNEEVVISDRDGNVLVVIAFLGTTRRGEARLGFRADDRFRIDRREIWEDNNPTPPGSKP